MVRRHHCRSAGSGQALASWLTRKGTVLPGCEGTGRGGWLRALRDPERAESFIQRCRVDKGTRRDVERPDTSSLGPSLHLQGPQGKGHSWNPGRVGAEASLEQRRAETLLGPKEGQAEGDLGLGPGHGEPVPRGRGLACTLASRVREGEFPVCFTPAPPPTTSGSKTFSH